MVDDVDYVGDIPPENMSTTKPKSLVGYVVDTPTRARDNDGSGICRVCFPGYRTPPIAG
jgi:hypothetical protein